MAPATPRPHASPAGDDAARVVELEKQVEQLKQAVNSHAEIDQAMGVVAAVGRIPPAEAWDVLREVSMRTNTRLRTVAAQVIVWARTGDLDQEIRSEIERQFVLRKAEAAAEALPEKS
ncbi:ANTAR domain-containing protein [Streptomyces sp. NPDC052225]|uniref:ANTAR domain-containing protein n=1 Tax=Streptomyces sp. NPDC052225 TaxID=3154949 RepID=UPI00344ACB99